jgi:hypothetical protein
MSKVERLATCFWIEEDKYGNYVVQVCQCYVLLELFFYFCVDLYYIDESYISKPLVQPNNL